MKSFYSRIASAPISWGICEVPGWGKMLPTDRVLSEMNNLGLPATELGAPGFLPSEANKISEKLDEFEMSLIGGFTPVVVHDKNQNEETLRQVKKVAELFKKTGATHLVSSPVYTWDWDAPKPLSADEYKNMFNMFSQIDKICEDFGLTNVLHPHLQTTVESKDEIERVLDGCDVKWCLDTGHMAIGGVDIVEFAKNAADRVGHVHLKDVDLSKATPVLARQESIMAGVQKGLFTPLGSGDVPIAQVINVLEGAGYQGWYVIEQDCAITGDLPPEGAGPALMMNKSMDYLKSLAIG
jgi:inosose dehydratase